MCKAVSGVTMALPARRWGVASSRGKLLGCDYATVISWEEMNEKSHSDKVLNTQFDK